MPGRRRATGERTSAMCFSCAASCLGLAATPLAAFGLDLAGLPFATGAALPLAAGRATVRDGALGFLRGTDLAGFALPARVGLPFLVDRAIMGDCAAEVKRLCGPGVT